MGNETGNEPSKGNRPGFSWGGNHHAVTAVDGFFLLVIPILIPYLSHRRQVEPCAGGVSLRVSLLDVALGGGLSTIGFHPSVDFVHRTSTRDDHWLDNHSKDDTGKPPMVSFGTERGGGRSCPCLR